MQASKMEWSKQITPNLQPDEWPEDVLDHMNAGIIMAMSDLRIETGCPMWPSPNPRGHVRESGESMHSLHDGDRLSKATDFFIRWDDFFNVYNRAIRASYIGGVGFYDSMIFRNETPGEYCMVHIDIRPGDLWWMGRGRDPVDYVYWDVNPAKYCRVLLEMLERR